MEGKVFGIPLVLIVFAILISALVNVPAYMMFQVNQNRLDAIDHSLRISQLRPSVAPTVTIAPSPTQEPTPTGRATKTSTNSGTVDR
jgi:hypothetical protein